MNLNEYQLWTKTTQIYSDDVARTYLTLGLAGEASEVCNKHKKEIRDGVNKSEEIIDELGDVLYYLSALALEMGITMECLAGMNYAKLSDRKVRGVLSGDGDNR